MAPISETKEDHSDDLDRIDAIWATFRLPVPIATEDKYDANHDGGDASSARHDDWLLEALDLLRLLRTMNQQYANPKAHAPRTTSRERRMGCQIALARSALARAERTLPAHDVDDDSNQVFYRNCHSLLRNLRNETEETCTKFQRWLDRRAAQQQHIPKERDLIYDIFLAPAPTTDEGDGSEPQLDDFSEDDEGDVYEGENAAPTPVQRQQPSRPTRQPQEDVDPVEFQRQQQELLEEELASMASRLKSSTLAMNKTLKTQTEELDEMEELAQTNLDQVADTTKKVEDRLAKKKGWKKRLATWSLIGTVVGTWVLCFMIMRTVPKRRIGETPNLFGRGGLFDRGVREGSRVWTKWQSYLLGEQVGPSGMPTSWEWERRRERAEQEDEERRWKIRQEQEWARQQQAQEAQRRRQQQRREERRQEQEEEEEEECEVLPDGTELCSNAKDEALAYDIAAERKRRRIEERMANAPTVEAVDHVEEEESTDESSDDDEESDHSSGNNDEEDPMGCIPHTEEMELHEEAVESLSKALSNLGKAMKEFPEGSRERINVSRQLDKLQSEHKKHATALQVQQNKARSAFWALEENRIKARDLRRALGSVSFCDGGAAEVGTEGEEPSSKSFKENDAQRYKRLEAERRRREEEGKEKFREEVRKAEEAQRRAEEEMERLERAREAAKVAKREEAAEQERAWSENAEARLENDERQEELRESEGRGKEGGGDPPREGEAKRPGQGGSASKAAKQREELERLRREQFEQRRLAAEQRRQEEDEARRLVKEEARLLMEEKRLAAEAARREEEERLKRERLEDELALANQRKKQEEEARRLAAEQARLEAERLEQRRLAAEAAKQAELEKLEQERILAERRKNEEEAQRLAEEEAERLEQERLAAEQAELERLEQERIWAELREKEEEARRLAEEEASRLEQERLAVEAAKQAELEKLEKERILVEQRKKEEQEARKLAEERARMKAEQLELERLAAEAAKQAELERYRQRIEQERILAERRKKEEEEARRLAEEEAIRLEQEKLVAEEEKKAFQISAAKANAEAEARRAIELSKEIAADNAEFLPSDIRFAAGRLKNDLLAHYVMTSPETADTPDRSGWRPIHEAARAGNLAGVQLLVEAGCDLTSRTGRKGKGGTALWWAMQRFGEDHDVVRLLRSHGALEDGPS
mmetsp:Transcript_34275/g.73040  ORF Transcript_34275/g.73040 Transcript_34275/m.73040 type:complete len:1173 (-) Transcript_34275:73-3591(-)